MWLAIAYMFFFYFSFFAVILSFEVNTVATRFTRSLAKLLIYGTEYNSLKYRGVLTDFDVSV